MRSIADRTLYNGWTSDQEKSMSRTTAWVRWLAFGLLALPLAAMAQQAFTTRTVNVRAGPDNAYPIVAQVGGGAPMQVMGCLADWSWCDVLYANLRGWVYGPYLTYAYRGGSVPLYTYAPSLGIPIVTFAVGPYWDRYYYGRPWYGRRDYWMGRPPPPHYRPPGPPPVYTPPPPPRPRPPPPPPRPPTIQPVPGPRPPPPNTGMPPPSQVRPPSTGQPPPSQGRPPSTGQPPPSQRPTSTPPPGGASGAAAQMTRQPAAAGGPQGDPPR
jgi:uncharacterized protein YraI